MAWPSHYANWTLNRNSSGGRSREFLEKLVSHYVLDGGRLVAAHAGLREDLHGRGSATVREFALYGDTTGETDEYGLPVRQNWAADYRGRARVVYGHTPTPAAEWLNHTICIDTGCVFGGALTALRYPEQELVAVPARAEYYAPIRPPHAPHPTRLSAQQQADDLLDLADVTGKRILHTRLDSAITIHEDHAAAALDAMSRFAANPKWLIYLPPTMAPPETSAEPTGWSSPPKPWTITVAKASPK
jgi:protein phosphatase